MHRVGEDDRVAVAAEADEPHQRIEVVEVLLLGESRAVGQDCIHHGVDLVVLEGNVAVEESPAVPRSSKLRSRLTSNDGLTPRSMTVPMSVLSNSTLSTPWSTEPLALRMASGPVSDHHKHVLNIFRVFSWRCRRGDLNSHLGHDE